MVSAGERVATSLAAALEQADYRTVERLSRRLGLSSGTLRRWADGGQPAPWVARAIAAELGVDVAELFPDRAHPC